MVAEDPVVGTPGVRLDDKDRLEVEQMPMGYGCPGIIPALHRISMPKRSNDI